MRNQSFLEGNASSFIVRPLRYLFEEGKPLPQMNTLWLQQSNGETRPFGVLTQTEAGRLIFWPPLPKDLPMLSPDGKKGALDHVTLELSNQRSHTTSFDGRGKRNHVKRNWILHEVAKSGLAQWFSILLPWSIIEQQDRLLGVSVQMPTTDSERRTSEFEKYAQSCAQASVPLPNVESGNYAYCVFYVCTQEMWDFSLVASNFHRGVDKLVTGFPDGTKFDVAGAMVAVGTTRVLIATAAPPGIAIDDVVLGFPTKHK